MFYVNDMDKIMLQTRSNTHGWHGSWDEDDDLDMITFAFYDGNAFISVVLFGIAPNHYTGINGLGEDIEVRYKRTMIWGPGYFRCIERAGHDFPDTSLLRLP